MQPLPDDELAALALAADPDAALPVDAVPIDVYLRAAAGPLPEWYMPAPARRRSTGTRRLVIMALVGAFVVIEAFGLCSTYGQLPLH